MPVLKVIRGDCQRQNFQLQPTKTVIGRSPHCEITLDHAAVSRWNTLIECENDHFFIIDLDSHNSTLVNGAPIHGRTKLDDGDEIQICGYIFSFQLHPSHRSDSAIEELVC